MAEEIDAGSLLLVGRIWKAHGVRGEVKVIPETDDPRRLEDLATVFTGRTPRTAERREVEAVRFQPAKRGTVVVLKLAGIESKEDADALRQLSVFAAAEDLPSLEEDEYFVHDLVGLEVLTESDVVIGRVESVLDLPAQDVLVVAREGREPAMIPVVDEFVVDVDVDGGRIVIRPIEGLL